MSGFASTASRCWRSSRATSRPPTAPALPSTTWVTMRARCAICRKPAAGSPQVRGRQEQGKGLEQTMKRGKGRAELLGGSAVQPPHPHPTLPSPPTYSLHTHAAAHSPFTRQTFPHPLVSDIHPATSSIQSLIYLLTYSATVLSTHPPPSPLPPPPNSFIHSPTHSHPYLFIHLSPHPRHIGHMLGCRLQGRQCQAMCGGEGSSRFLPCTLRESLGVSERVSE